MRRFLLGLAGVLVLGVFVAAGLVIWIGLGIGGSLPGGGSITPQSLPREAVAARHHLRRNAARGLAGPDSDTTQMLCLGECYHPGERRRPIDRVEVVRIRPQVDPEEPVGGLIEDPWRSFPCSGDEAGCAIEFEDPELLASGRSAVYYVRHPAPNSRHRRRPAPLHPRRRRTLPGVSTLLRQRSRLPPVGRLPSSGGGASLVVPTLRVTSKEPGRFGRSAVLRRLYASTSVTTEGGTT